MRSPFSALICVLLVALPAFADGMGDSAPEGGGGSSSSPSRSGGNKAAAAAGIMILLNEASKARDSHPAQERPTDLPKVTRVYGPVRYQKGPGEPWIALNAGDIIPVGAVVRTGTMSSVEAAIGSRAIFALAEKTAIELRVASASGHFLSLSSGRISNTVTPSRDRSYLIRTSTADVYVKGTEFDVEVDEQGRTIARSYSGTVGVRTPTQEVAVDAGHEAVIGRDGSVEKLGEFSDAPASPFGFTAAWIAPGGSAPPGGAPPAPPSSSGSPRRPPENARMIDPSTYPAEDQVLRTRGELTQTDARRDNGTYYDRYTVPVRGGEVYTVQLLAGTFDPYLIVTVPGGGVYENDNGARNTYNAQVTVSAPSDGEMSIVATSPNAPQLGVYKLSVCREHGGAALSPMTSQGAAPTPSPSSASADAKIRLSWRSSPGARKYRVYEQDGRNWKRVEETVATALDLDSLERGSDHILSVTAVGENGESRPGENALLLKR